MAKKIKDKLIYTRVDSDAEATIKAYVEAAHTDVSELVRTAVDEYMINHPVAQAAEQEAPSEPSVA